MEAKRIITIGRQLGSGGGSIGRIIAKELGIGFYDKELINLASKTSGLCKEVFEKHDEKPVNSFFYSLTMDARSSSGTFSGGYVGVPLDQKVFLAQFETIQKLAEKESCVIVGRCADYALEKHENLVTVFIHADMQDRVDRISMQHEITKDAALELIAKTDKKRANYYNYYSNKKWGNASTYDLCLNSSKLGIEGTAEAILNYLRLRDVASSEDK